MRSTNDPIAGLKQKLLDWGVTSEEELKGIDKKAREHVDEEVAIAEKMDIHPRDLVRGHLRHGLRAPVPARPDPGRELLLPGEAC